MPNWSTTGYARVILVLIRPACVPGVLVAVVRAAWRWGARTCAPPSEVGGRPGEGRKEAEQSCNPGGLNPCQAANAPEDGCESIVDVPWARYRWPSSGQRPHWR